MIYQFSNPYDVTKAQEYLSSCIEKEWNVSITHLCPKRSDKQNRYLHAILGYFGSQVGLSIDEVKQDVFKKLVNRELFFYGVKDVGGHEVEKWKSTSALSTMEMTLAIDRFRNFSASEMGIYISSPDDENFLIYCEQQIEKVKEFI